MLSYVYAPNYIILEDYNETIAMQHRMNLTKSPLRNIDKYTCKHKSKFHINFHEIENNLC